MSYSIGIRTKSPGLQKKMLKFMQVHYRSWPAVLGDPKGNAYAGEPSDDLSYDRAKSVIGLDYGVVSGWERVYAYAVVRWMAIKVGAIKSRYPVVPKRTPQPVPYIVYDGYESWPVIVVETTAALKKLPQESRWCAATPLGMYADPLRYVDGDLVLELAEDCTQMFRDIEAKVGSRGPNSGPKAHAAWVAKRHRLMMPYCRKKLRVQLKPLKAEMQRLEDLWDQEQ